LAELYRIYSNTRLDIFTLNLALKYVRSSSIRTWSIETDDAKPDHSEQYHVEPHQVRCQIIICDLYSSKILCSVGW